MATGVTRDQVVAVAYGLFYTRGIQSVGMAELCQRAEVSRKTFYSMFASKDDLVAEVITQWHVVFMASVAARASKQDSSRDTVLSVFDFLADWFGSGTFRGCGFINTFGELGTVSPQVATIAREHKKSFQDYLAAQVGDAGWPAWLAPQLALLVEGAITTAAIAGTSDPAQDARRAAATLIDAARLVAVAA